MQKYFCAKVKFKDHSNVHTDLKDKEFCLLGYTDNAIALIEWDKRGEYTFDYYTASLKDLIILEQYELKASR